MSRIRGKCVRALLLPVTGTKNIGSKAVRKIYAYVGIR